MAVQVWLLNKHCPQGTVHDVTAPDGSPNGRVLKAMRSAPGASWLIAMEWEWIVGAATAPGISSRLQTRRVRGV